MTLALSTCVLLISLVQLGNGEQFLNINFLLVVFASASAATVLVTVTARFQHRNFDLAINIVCSS